MGWFKDLLGVEKAVDVAGDFVNSGMSILDEAFDTDQEKGERKIEVFNGWLEMQRVIGAQNSPTSLSRRYIAWAVISLVWLEVVVCTALILAKPAGYAEQVSEIVSLLVAFQIGWAFCAVIVFYFGTHVIGKLKS